METKVTKVILTITLPGGQLVSKAEEKANPRKACDFLRIPMPERKFNKKTGKKELVSGGLNVFPRKTIPAHLTRKLSVEQWLAFQSKDCLAYGYRPGEWAKLSKKERLEAHFRDLCHDSNGLGYTYEVLED